MNVISEVVVSNSPLFCFPLMPYDQGVYVGVAVFCFADTHNSAKSWKCTAACYGNTLSASVSDHDKQSRDIIHPWIFTALTKQLPLKVPKKGGIKGNQAVE